MSVEENGAKAVNGTDSSQWLSPFSVGKDSSGECIDICDIWTQEISNQYVWKLPEICFFLFS